MPTEQKSNESELFQEPKVTSDIDEPRKEKDEQIDPELGRVDIGAIPLEIQPQPQQNIVDQEGFVVSYIIPYNLPQTQNYLFASPFQAYRDCELVAITVWFKVKSTQGGAAITIQKGRDGSENALNNTTIDLTQTAQTTYIYEGDDLIKQYTYFTKGDYIKLQAVNTLTALQDLCFTFYFKHSGRGETRFD